jgi:hypothetical protein
LNPLLINDLRRYIEEPPAAPARQLPLGSLDCQLWHMLVANICGQTQQMDKKTSAKADESKK